MLQDLQEDLKEQDVTLGTDTTLKALKKDELSKIYIAENTAEDVEDTLNHYKSITGIEIVKLNVRNDELGAICKKPFHVQCVGVKA